MMGLRDITELEVVDNQYLSPTLCVAQLPVKESRASQWFSIGLAIFRIRIGVIITDICWIISCFAAAGLWNTYNKLQIIVRNLSLTHTQCRQEVQKGEENVIEVTLTVEWLLMAERVVWVSLNSWGFHTLQLTDMKIKKNIQWVAFCGQKHLVIERSQRRMARLVQAHRLAIIIQVTACHNGGVRKSMSDRNTLQTWKWTSCRRRPRTYAQWPLY